MSRSAREEPIQEFFAGCDAVLLCLDPEGSTDPAERRRRQQEIENLLERYIERSEDLSTDRPVALLLTKFDRVLAGQSRGTRVEDPDEPRERARLALCRTPSSSNWWKSGTG